MIGLCLGIYEEAFANHRPCAMAQSSQPLPVPLPDSSSSTKVIFPLSSHQPRAEEGMSVFVHLLPCPLPCRCSAGFKCRHIRTVRVHLTRLQATQPSSSSDPL